MGRYGHCVAAAAVALIIIGCSKPLGSLSGKIEYKNKPVSNAVMLCVDADGKRFPASINADGTYLASNLPSGEYVITVKSIAPDDSGADEKAPVLGQKMPEWKIPENISPELKAQMEKNIKEIKGKRPSKSEPIPEKYADPKTSGLTVTINGNKTKDITLTD